MRSNVRINAVFFMLIYVVLALIMLFVRQKTGYMMPDEIFYLNDMNLQRADGINISLLDSTSEGISVKYFVVTALFQYIYAHGELLIYFFNIVLVSVALFVSYSDFARHQKIACGLWWGLMFLMPTVLFFSVSILRDIYLFILVVFLLVAYKKKPVSVMTALILLIIWLLRPEFGLSISVALFISCLKRPTMRKRAVVLYLLVAFGFMAYLALGSDFYADRWGRALVRNDSFGIFEFTDVDAFFPYYLLSNIVLFYFPLIGEFFWTTRFGNLMLIYCGVNFFIFFKIIVRYGFSFTRNDRLSNFAVLNIITFIPIAANETDASAALRHALYTLPFLYLYIIRCVATNDYRKRRVKW